jgi:predicted transcriptional regulator of viral defense system
MNRLKSIGNIPVDYSVLESVFSDYKYPRNKVASLEMNGSLIRLKRGMYVVSPSVSGKLVSAELTANHIYGPSYISMESALRFYSLIPENVHTVKSMTVKRSREFNNLIGRFSYIYCDTAYYAIGIDQKMDENNTILIASPEKAICDLIVYTPTLRLRFKKSLKTYLEEDIRLDMEAFYKMNSEIIRMCSIMGKKKNDLKNLLKLLEE